MRAGINRLSAGPAASECAIDRDRPLRFRLDGCLISGFAGDTVLSAAMASGVDTLGLYRNQPLGLTLSANPAIGLAREPGAAFSMARMPALDGAELITLGVRRANPLARLMLPGRSLGVALDRADMFERPWRHRAGTVQTAGDLVVIGGGVAGMEAALAAAEAGLSVTLVEAGSRLGGHSGLFGTQDGEASPEADMSRLREAVAANDAINVLTHSHAYALTPGLVRLHRSDIADGVPQGLVLDLQARFVILATGSRERLPVFAGNRLPGVIGTRDAHELACRYHVWPGKAALVATSSNVAYRLATLASDWGIRIDRILDSRPQPSSRFIAFSRAYGMVQMPGVAPERAGMARAGGALSIHTGQAVSEPILTERLLVCGGWQPDLTLWHVAGGRSRWSAVHHRLEAEGGIDGFALAGSAAGYFTRRGCIESGRDAVNALLNRPRKPVNDPLIDPLHESPDAPLSIAGARNNAAPAFLDHGRTLLQRPSPPNRSWLRPFRREPPASGLAALSEIPQPLTLGEVAAGVDLGLIPPDAAGIVAQERVALVALAAAAKDVLPAHDGPTPEEIPAYLEGRFGGAPTLVRLVPEESRQLPSGALIFRNSDPAGPLEAIGVVLRPAGNGALALMASGAAGAGLPVSIRDQGRPIAARIDKGDGPKA